MFIIGIDFNDNFATFRSELERVREEIDNDLSQSDFIGNHDFVFNRCVKDQVDVDFLQPALRAHELNAVFEHLLQIKLGERVLEHSKLERA